ncbi:sterol desaturase family protein [Sandarakinorhabdus oryzae]|uniref:sterol desaturase family protein n=1 Tax=Sandarakinorhabdus oryzae TaxID=2675220 RepID=UPI0018CC4CAF|nr:sterol desaturase family protein [Sandarakinorhabdus oryzae]
MTSNRLKDMLFRYMQPGLIVAIVAWWTLLPPSLASSATTFFWTGIAIKGFVLLLEAFNERHASWRLTPRELLSDVIYVALGYTVVQWLDHNIAERGYQAFKAMVGIKTPWLTAAPVALQAALVVVLLEFGQYWMHRGMHNWRPLWLTHAPHHYLTQLNALKGHVGNPIELFLVGLSVVSLFDFSLPGLFAGFSVLTAIFCFAHANVRFNPPAWYAHVFTTIESHSLHHSMEYEDTRCNYANALILLDRMFGTFRAGETAEVGQEAGRKLGIKDVMVYPFTPLIDGARGMLKGSRA